MDQRIDDVLTQFQQQIDSYRHFLSTPPSAESLGLNAGEFIEERISLVTREVSQRTTQFHLAFQDNPNFDDCAPFANLLAKDLLNLVSLSLIPATSPSFCRAFRRQFRDGVEAILEATSTLALAVVKQRKSKSTTSFAPYTGKVWEACKQYQALPLLNHVATKAVLSRWLPLIRDTTQELQQLLEESRKDEDEDQDDADDEWDFEDEPLSAEERRVIPGCVTLLKCSYNMLRKLVDLLGSPALNARHRDESVVAWLDAIFDAVEGLMREIDEFGAACHPPIAFSTLESNARAVRARNESLQQLVAGGLARYADDAAAAPGGDGAHKANGALDDDSQRFLALLREKLAEAMEQILEAAPTPGAAEQELSNLKLQ